MYQLPVQRIRAAARWTSGRRSATSTQSASVTARCWTRNATGAARRIDSMSSGSAPPLAGSGFVHAADAGERRDDARERAVADVAGRAHARAHASRARTRVPAPGRLPLTPSPKRSHESPSRSSSTTKPRVPGGAEQVGERVPGVLAVAQAQRGDRPRRGRARSRPRPAGLVRRRQRHGAGERRRPAAAGATGAVAGGDDAERELRRSVSPWSASATLPRATLTATGGSAGVGRLVSWSGNGSASAGSQRDLDDRQAALDRVDELVSRRSAGPGAGGAGRRRRAGRCAGPRTSSSSEHVAGGEPEVGVVDERRARASRRAGSSRRRSTCGTRSRCAPRAARPRVSVSKTTGPPRSASRSVAGVDPRVGAGLAASAPGGPPRARRRRPGSPGRPRR